jgi:inosose dehydratase
MSFSSRPFSRRDALKGAALAAIGFPLLRPLSMFAAAPISLPDRTRGIKLGLASYTLNTLTVDQVIAVASQLELKTVSLFRLHCPWGTGTVEECRAVVKKFADAGITVTSTGVVELPNEETVVRKAFDNIKGAGMKKFVGRPTIESLPLVEKFVKEYDLTVAIHNHGPTDRYPKAADAYKAIQPYDKRIGLCVDVGHGWLADEDPAATIRLARDRIYEVHLKDTRGPKDGKSSDAGPVIVGRGLVDIKAVLAALVEIKFAHEVEFEYEEPVPNKVPGLAESVGYTRGLLAAL